MKDTKFEKQVNTHINIRGNCDRFLSSGIHLYIGLLKSTIILMFPKKTICLTKYTLSPIIYAVEDIPACIKRINPGPMWVLTLVA